MIRLTNITCFILLISAMAELAAQPSRYQFERIDMSKGLSHHTVNDILKDSSGFVCF
jgi:hypothetical protein